jgi:membrane protease YdiL (CAAX protease family)
LSAGASRRCRACGVPNLAEARYCRGCGTLLPEPDATPAPEPLAPPARGDIAEQAWREVRGVAWLFLALVTLVVGAVIAEKAGAGEAATDLVVTSAVGLLALALTAVAWRDVRPLLATTGGLRGAAVASGAFLALFAFGAAYFGACRWLGFPLVRATDAHVAAGWPAWASYLLISAAPGVCEELLFRGYVMERLSRALTANEALLVQAALFSVLHFGVVIFPSHFVIGLMLGLVRRLSGSLYPGMAVHAAWNAHVVWTELG